MDTIDFITTLHEAIAESDDFRADGGHVSIQNLAESGFLSADEGLVVRLPDGSEYMIIVKQTVAPITSDDE